jgi:hypothetical protein
MIKHVVTVLYPHSLAPSHLDDPYAVTAAGLDDAILRRQLSRLNPQDQISARRHLGLVSDDNPEHLRTGEKAVAKLRHPSVAQVWKFPSKQTT